LIIVWAIKAAIIKIYFHVNFTVFCCPGSSPNMEVTGAARLYHAAPVWTAGLETNFALLEVVGVDTFDNVRSRNRNPNVEVHHEVCK